MNGLTQGSAPNPMYMYTQIGATRYLGRSSIVFLKRNGGILRVSLALYGVLYHYLAVTSLKMRFWATLSALVVDPSRRATGSL